MPERDPITSQIIAAAYKVANGLGPGFLEKVYENALAHEVRRAGLRVAQQQGLEVHYDGIIVGEFNVDLLVENTVLVELKACRALDDVHVAQCLNHLAATGRQVCLLINFGRPKIEIRRLMMDLQGCEVAVDCNEPIFASDGQR